MFLSLKNIGIIETAEIELNAITVIAGENGSGKSTIGKALYCVFNSFFDVEKRMYEEKSFYIGQLIAELYHSSTNRLTRRFDTEELAESIIRDRETNIYDIELLKSEIKNLIKKYDPIFENRVEQIKLNETTAKIISIFKITDHEILIALLQKRVEAEFNEQIKNLNNPKRNSEISFMTEDSEIKIQIRNDKSIKLSNSTNFITEAIYIDDPYVLDNTGYMTYHRSYGSEPTHRDRLRLSLLKEAGEVSVRDAIGEIIAGKKLDKIFEKLNSICIGEMVRKTPRTWAYKDTNSKALIDIGNVSTGLKTFVIIKTLLLNGSLSDNGILILDEPEIHLHPEWQLVFAELIVLIQIEFDMRILVNTHSPYFLNAIEVYSQKHGIADKCRYYLAEIKGKSSSIRDVTSNIEDIYQKLARPLQDLENEGYADV